MSLHKSWSGGGATGGARGGKVMKREERIALMKKNGHYTEGSYYNLAGGASKAWEATVAQKQREDAKA